METKQVTIENSALSTTSSQIQSARSSVMGADTNQSYLASVKLQKDFLDQNFNTAERDLNSLTFDDEVDVNTWGIWTPETERYWTIQYSDAKRALEKVEDDKDDDTRDDGQRLPSAGDTVILVDETEQNNSGTPKKFLRDHTDDGSKNPPPPRPNLSNLRRVTFWVCSTTAQPVDIDYDNPVVRARFVARVLLLKSIQLVIILASILGISRSPFLLQFHRKSVLPIWIASVVYVMLLLSVKSTLLGITKTGAAICFFIQTLCLIEICCAIVSVSEPYVMACVLTVLILTYLIISAFSKFLTLDLLNSNNLFGLTWILVFVMSIGVVGGLSHALPKVVGRSIVVIIGHYWIPTLLCSETVILLTLSELYQILQGNRIPLLTSEFDWIQATAQLY